MGAITSYRMLIGRYGRSVDKKGEAHEPSVATCSSPVYNGCTDGLADIVDAIRRGNLDSLASHVLQMGT